MKKELELLEKFKAHMTWDDENKYWICPEENIKMFEEKLKEVLGVMNENSV